MESSVTRLTETHDGADGKVLDIAEREQYLAADEEAVRYNIIMVRFKWFYFHRIRTKSLLDANKDVYTKRKHFWLNGKVTCRFERTDLFCTFWACFRSYCLNPLPRTFLCFVFLAGSIKRFEKKYARSSCQNSTVQWGKKYVSTLLNDTLSLPIYLSFSHFSVCDI